jgi:4-amino-4-deoxy-L-arabinose transferase-like glycosyltransferase
MESSGNIVAKVLRSRGFLIAVLILAAALRIWHVFALREVPLFDRLIIDSEVYDAWAQRIAAGDWLSAVLDRPFYMDPLYSYFLGAMYRVVGRDLLLVRLTQVALGVATCALVARLGRELRDAASGNLAALLLALYGPSIFQEGEFEKTALGVFLATGALVLFLGKSPWSRLAAGVAIGLAALTRGNMLLLAPFAVGHLAVRREWRSATAVLIGLGISVAPVALRNYHVSHEWVLTTSGMGQVFYTGNNPSNADGAHHSVPFARPQASHEEGDFLREAERRAGRSLSAQAASWFWFREGLAHVLRSPSFAASVMARKAGLFWSDVEVPDAWDMSFVARFSPPLRLPLVSFSLMAGLAILGCFPAIRTVTGRLVIGYVVLYSASVVAFFIFSRYRLHVVPPLAALAGSGLVWTAERIRKTEYRSVALPVSAAVAVGAFSALSFPSRRQEATSNYAALAEIYQEREDFVAARRLLSEALTRSSEDANLLCAMGKLCLRSHDPACGMDFTSRCLRVNPTFPDGWYLFGLACEASGDLGCAREAYTRQLILVPGHEAALGRLRQ